MGGLILPGLSKKSAISRRAEEFERHTLRGYAVVGIDHQGELVADYEIEPTPQELNTLMTGLVRLHQHLLAVAARNAGLDKKLDA